MPEDIADAARICRTPAPPYTAVILTALRTSGDRDYIQTAIAMEALAREQEGYLGIEWAGDDLQISVSYWRDAAAARTFKRVGEHLAVQQQGREVWYSHYHVRVATVHRSYGPAENDEAQFSAQQP